MRYLTAQLVHSTRYRGEGINAYAHHRPGRLQELGDASAALTQLEQDPGTLLGCAVQIPPGNNSVRAFLDLVADDDADLPSCLRELQARATPVDQDTILELSGGALARHYGLATAATSAPEPLVAALVASAQLASQRPPVVPLRIVVDRSEDICLFRLDPQTQARVQQVHDKSWSYRPLRAEDAGAEDFARFHGPVLPHVVQVVTGLTPRDVEGLGGMVMTLQDGREVARWPAASWYPAAAP